MFYLTPYARHNHVNVFDPFKEFEDLERSLFAPQRHAAGIRTDVSENEKEYILEAELPGFNKDEINVGVENDVLTVKAERKAEKEEKDESGNVIRRERRFGSFERSFDISEVNAEGITASYENGILKLVLPKKEEEASKVRQIEIA